MPISIILVKEIVKDWVSKSKPGTKYLTTEGAKIKAIKPKTKTIKNKILKTEFVIFHASSLFLLQYFKKIGIKAEDKAPRIKVLKIKSGNLKAA